ncbi:MAG: site-2 protease family protein [Blastocatellia bacterium]|nr:site-2 protease family protein [Blastocatellia bacterium]
MSMDQPYLFPTPATEPPTEDPQSTVVYRLPQSYDLQAQTVRHDRPGAITGRQLRFHLFLLGLTVLTTTFVVGYFWLNGLMEGLIYSFTVLTILAAHEMGHYIACRWYGVDATLPYFIPVPLPPIGTFGAFIKMRSPILTRRALFDIGIAGPIAGYVFAVPAAFIGHYFSQAAPFMPGDGESIIINDPLLFKFFQQALHLPSMLLLNPVMWAAWVGVFMTSLNLLPVGQLDGGHVAYALFGPRGHKLIGMISYLSVIGLAVYSIRNGMWNWVVYVALLTLVMRVGHPPVVDASEPLGLARKLVAVIGLLIFILSFLPVPISF